MADDENVERMRVRQKGRGRHAQWPHRIPAAGWWDIAQASLGGDHRQTASAWWRPAATFYLILALFPALAAFVSLYGLVAESGDDRRAHRVHRQRDAARRLQPDLRPAERARKGRIRTRSASASSSAFWSALWSANNGIKTIFEALNIAYEEREKRSFVRLNLLSLVFTLGAMLMAALLVISVGVVPARAVLMQLGGAIALS